MFLKHILNLIFCILKSYKFRVGISISDNAKHIIFKNYILTTIKRQYLLDAYSIKKYFENINLRGNNLKIKTRSIPLRLVLARGFLVLNDKSPNEFLI